MEPIRSRKFIIALAALAVVGVIVFFIATKGLTPHATAPSVERFTLFEEGRSASYTLDAEGKVARGVGPIAFPGTPFVTKFVGVTLASGDTPVIIDSPAGSATGLAVVRSDGALIPLLDDSVSKYGLSARTDGRVVFAEYGLAGVQLLSASVYDPAPVRAVKLGPGFSPAFSGDGAIVAVAPEGLVRVNALKLGRTTIIDRPGMSYAVAAVSPDAAFAVLPNEITRALDIFSISPINSNRVSYVASVPVEAQAVAFVGVNSFIVKTAKTFTVYTIENGSVVTQSTYLYAS